MARAPVSIVDSTIMLSCFVMGAELLLLFCYIRTQILVGIKRRVFDLVKAELLREDRFLGGAEPTRRPSFEQLHSSFCADSYGNSSLLAILGYALATAFLVSLLSKIRTSKDTISSGPTLIASAAAGMTVFLGSQWGFLKLAVLPFYSDLYDRVTGQDNPSFEKDPPAVSLKLLGPTITCMCVLLVVSLAAFGRINWGAVAFTALISVFSLGTEVISWFLMKGFAVPVTEIVSSVTDAVTAVLWVNRDNPPSRAVDMLRESLFPDGDPSLTASNLFRHVYRDHFDRRRLEVDEDGSLVMASARSDRIRALVMIACSACLILCPFVVVALRAPAMDAAVIVFQLLLIAGTYGIYMFTTGETTTMVRITRSVAGE